MRKQNIALPENKWNGLLAVFCLLPILLWSQAFYATGLISCLFSFENILSVFVHFFFDLKGMCVGLIVHFCIAWMMWSSLEMLKSNYA